MPKLNTDTLRGARRAVGKAMSRPATYRGFLKEAALTGVNLAFYPAGLLSQALKVEQAVRLGDRYRPHIPLRYLDPEAATTPVILLHGYFHNRSAFMVMKRALRRYGFTTVDTMNYNVVGRDIPALAAQLRDHVEQVLETAGATKVHLVGHSLGGLVARTYIQTLGGHDKVHTCITLGTPHRGTHAAWVTRGPAARQLRPGSPLLRKLARTARPMPVRFISFYSNIDALVLPPANAKITERSLRARNILVKDLGHASLLISRPLIRSIAVILSSLDEEAPAEFRRPQARRTPSRRRSVAPNRGA